MKAAGSQGVRCTVRNCCEMPHSERYNHRRRPRHVPTLTRAPLNNYQLIAALARSFAWPVTAIILAMLARPILRDIAKRVRTLKYKDVEASLEDLDRLTSGPAHSRLATSPGTSSPTSNLDASLAKLVESAPAATLEASWRRVRDAIMRAAYTIEGENGLDWTDSLEILLRDKVITPRDLSILTVLSTIRQSVYYEGAIVSPAAVVDFIAQSNRISAHVHDATEPSPRED
jgi:hypothetical protein